MRGFCAIAYASCRPSRTFVASSCWESSCIAMTDRELRPRQEAAARITRAHREPDQTLFRGESPSQGSPSSWHQTAHRPLWSAFLILHSGSAHPLRVSTLPVHLLHTSACLRSCRSNRVMNMSLGHISTHIFHLLQLPILWPLRYSHSRFLLTSFPHPAGRSATRRSAAHKRWSQLWCAVGDCHPASGYC